MPGVAQRVPGS